MFKLTFDQQISNVRELISARESKIERIQKEISDLKQKEQKLLKQKEQENLKTELSRTPGYDPIKQMGIEAGKI